MNKKPSLQNGAHVYRIVDTRTGEFYRSGKAVSANNGRTVWTSINAAGRARSVIPAHERIYFVVCEYALTLVKEHEAGEETV